MIQPPDFQPLFRFGNRIAAWIHDQGKTILISATVTVLLSLSGIGATKFRNNLLAQFTGYRASPAEIFHRPTPTDQPVDLTSASQSADVLGTNNVSKDDTSVETYTYNSAPIATPTLLPTWTPFPTPVIPDYTSSDTSSSTTGNSSSGTGNPNCTTGAGEPNSWYSDVYPASPQSSVVGSAVTFSVVLRDCFRNDANVSDTLKISLTSGDNSVQINGNNLPYTLKTNNGKAAFTVTSSNAGTYGFSVQDTTKSFTVTDPNNHNPSVVFSNNTSGNANCTTKAGVSNAWYSDVYPASPVTVTLGNSAGFSVEIRDCNRNDVNNDTLVISLTSGDNSVQVNGNNLPYTLKTDNGKASFSVTSSKTGTYGFMIKNTSAGFTVTDPNNHNPSVVFSSPSQPAPTASPTPGATTTPGVTPTPAPVTSTPSPSPTPTSAGPAPTTTPTPIP